MEVGGGCRRKSLLDEMSARPERRDSLAGMTLEAVLSDRRGSGANSRTLFDIIRDDPTAKSLYGHKDRKSWKVFRDKLRLKRAAAVWTSSVHIPTSDIPFHDANTNSSSQFARRSSAMSSSNNSSEASASDARAQFTRRSFTRVDASAPTPTPSGSNNHDDLLDISVPGEAPPSRSFRSQISGFNSSLAAPREGDEYADDTFEVAREGTRRLAAVLAEERVFSAREAAAAQEAAEAVTSLEAGVAAAPEAEASSSEEAQPIRMSLMDLLEETDREIGTEGSNYTMGEYDEEELDDVKEEEAVAVDGGGGIENNCCVCMVRHKGAAFIPCGHTFCRLCSRELWVQRGNCPICNNFIVEILDLF